MIIAYIAGGLSVGFILLYIISNRQLKTNKISHGEQIKALHNEYNLKLHQKELEKNEAVTKVKEEIENSIKNTKEELQTKKKEIDDKSRNLDKKADIIEKKDAEILQREKTLNETNRKLEEKDREITEIRNREQSELQKIARMSPREAREQLMKRVEEEAKEDAQTMYKRIVDNARRDAQRESVEIVAQAVQRNASEVTQELTVSSVSIPDEDMKGRIIGREGRNIRAIEQATGVNLIIDDTPPEL
ncbi:MAG: Rnase Y domain-containing protein [Elusimicrobiota bacterium]